MSPHFPVEPLYQHRQSAVLIHVLLGSGVTFLIAFMASNSLHPVGLVVTGLLVIAWVLFSSLTIGVDRERVAAAFGPGLVRLRWDLADVTAVRRVRNRWWNGWGIRWIPGGWLYNVSGLDAVEMQLRDGRRIRLGTDEPDALLEALEAALRQRDTAK